MASNSVGDNEEISLRNCRFAFRCPMKWGVLVRTEKEDIRYCPECDRGVYLCRTDSDLAEALKKNRCVAIVMIDDAGIEVPDRLWPLGDIAPTNF